MCFQNAAPRPLRPLEQRVAGDSNRRIKSNTNVYKNERGILDILPSLVGRVTSPTGRPGDRVHACSRRQNHDKVDSLLGASIEFADLAESPSQIDSIFERISRFVIQKKYLWTHQEMFSFEKYKN